MDFAVVVVLVTSWCLILKLATGLDFGDRIEMFVKCWNYLLDVDVRIGQSDHNMKSEAMSVTNMNKSVTNTYELSDMSSPILITYKDLNLFTKKESGKCQKITKLQIGNSNVHEKHMKYHIVYNKTDLLRYILVFRIRQFTYSEYQTCNTHLKIGSFQRNSQYQKLTFTRPGLKM